ncbi:MAG: hypothetical protein IKG46_11225 [Solobacterium sp.]|nr:hypothetical protein [Solobacterium sp.]
MKEVFKVKKEMVQIPEGTFNQYIECKNCPDTGKPEWRGSDNGYMYWCSRHNHWEDVHSGCTNSSIS